MRRLFLGRPCVGVIHCLRDQDGAMAQYCAMFLKEDPNPKIIQHRALTGDTAGIYGNFRDRASAEKYAGYRTKAQ